MNLGDGLLFELENGKPKLTLLNAGVEKNARKPPCRPRPANVLSTRQPTCVEKVQGEVHLAEPRSRRDGGIGGKAGGAAACSASVRKSACLNSAKAREQAGGGRHRLITNGLSGRHDHSIPHGCHGASEKVPTSGTVAGAKPGARDTVGRTDYAIKKSVADLTAEQLQRILSIVETTCNGPGPSEDRRTRGNRTHLRCVSPEIDEDGAEKRCEQDRGEEEEEEEELVEGCDATSQNKSAPGGLFSWLDGRRAATDGRKQQRKRELGEQVAQKPQAHWSAPPRQQAGEESVPQVYKEQPAALRSNLRLGAITPMEEVPSVRRREEQKRRWLEELNKQREETAERRRREKLLQSQPEEHELWASHFDSLQRRPPVPAPAPTPTPPEQREWGPTSRLSLLSEAASTYGGEGVGGSAAPETNWGHPTRASRSSDPLSYLRTMTALLDPAQLEERDRRRIKQLELQRAIEAQVEEKRRQKEQERATKREEEAEEERRLCLERRMLEKRYKMDVLKEKQDRRKTHHSRQDEGSSPEMEEEEEEEEGEEEQPRSCRTAVCRDGGGAEEAPGSARACKDAGVQTEAAVGLPLTAGRVDTPGVPAQPHLPAPPPPNRKNQAGKRGKENICRPGEGADPYQAFARTEQRKEPRRWEWNAHRPGQQLVPASERQAAPVQKTRQERRPKRQAELLALQGRPRLPRTSGAAHRGPPRCSAIAQGGTGSSSKVSREHSSTLDVHARGRRPAGAQTQRDPSSSTPPLPEFDFIPYVRTQEVLNLDPLEPDNGPPPRTQADATPAPSHQAPPLLPELFHNTHELQETLRSLAQLRRGLLLKQRELERDLSPVLRHYENQPR